MNGKIDLITLIALIVAVVAILKLRSVLGRRTSDDETRYQERVRAEQASASGKVVALPGRGGDLPSRTNVGQTAIADIEQRIKEVATTKDAEEGLLAIVRSDQSFDPQHFMEGAKQAYEMIVTAFAEGNKKILKDLLSSEVYDGFVEAINGRESRGEQIDQSFVGINKSDIIEAELKGSTAQVTVKFISQLISATRDRSGAILSGDAQKITEVTDIWSFARDLKSSNPNWRLVATQAAS